MLLHQDCQTPLPIVSDCRHFEYQNIPIHVMSHPYASAYFTALTPTFDFEKVVRCDQAKDQIWTCFASSQLLSV
jgi:hypothetical protein